MRTVRPTLLRAAALVAVAGLLPACGSAAGTENSASSSSGGTTTVVVADKAGPGYTPTTLQVPAVPQIAAQVPKAVRDRGTLIIGVGALPAGYPPLVFTGTDNKTIVGSEPDLGRLVAAVLGLKATVSNATWENMFIGFQSGRTDVGFSNITDTEERKQKYDFASYREDNLGFEVRGSDPWEFAGDYRNLAGRTVAVGSGTNQEKILLEWKKKLKAQGKDVTVKYFPDSASTYLALDSGRIDTYFGPNPGIAYHLAQGAKNRNAGTFSGAGETLQGLIAATTLKGDGLAQPVAAAINCLIEHGQYAAWLKAYGLSNEAVAHSQINPAGLPLSNS